MSPVELLPAAGPSTPIPASSGQGDAVGFAGLLGEQGRPAAPRGRLGVGRVLAEQAELDPRTAYSDPTLGPLVLPGLLTPPTSPLVPAGDGRHVLPALPETPQVLPAQPDGAAQPKTAGPQVLPGVSDGAAQAKGEGPLVLPGVPDGSSVAKTEGALVVPGDAPAAIDDALALLAASGVQTRAEGAADAVRRAVAQAPAVAAVDPGDPAAPELPAEGPALSLSADAGAAEAGPAPTAQATPAATSTVEAAARPEAPVTRLAEVATQEDANVEAPAEPSLDPLPAAARESGGPQLVRADGAAAQRLSFDAVTQVAAQIIRRLEGRSTRFEMELHPADMGRGDVRLDIDAEGRVAARLAFDNPAAAADMRGRAAELRRNLEEAGFLLSDDALSFADREEQGGRQGFESADRDPFARSARAADVADVEAQPALRALSRLGLDVRI